MLTILFYARLVLCIFMMVDPSFAQVSAPTITAKLFQWAFQDTSISTFLPTCESFPIIVKSFNTTTNATNGIPPYYMISFPVGGTPVTSFIGTDENNLLWNVNQPINSQLILSVVDSMGNPGGIPPRLITVTPGQTTSCITTPPSAPAFTVTANVTGTIETCVPWGITVSGGSPPYVVTLAETNSPVVTNVTMPFGTDRFTFINRADPGGVLIAGVSDLEGRWAAGTPMVKPVGSSDVSCIGLVSSSGDSKAITAQDNALNAAANAARRKRETSLAVGIVFLFLAIGALGSYLFWRRRKRNREIHEKRGTIQATQFEDPMLRQISEPQPVFEPVRRWNVGSDRKASLPGDLEAPPYVASGSRFTQRADSGSAALSARPQLARLQMPQPAVASSSEKPARYLQSAVPSAQSATPGNTTRNNSLGDVGSTLRSGFSTFPVNPIRASLSGRENPGGKARSASARALPSERMNPAPMPRRNAPDGDRHLFSNPNPFVSEEEEDVLDNYARYYQDSESGSEQSLPPRYRSIRREGRRRYGSS